MPRTRSTDYVQHIHREHNQDADREAGKYKWDVLINGCLSRSELQYLQVYFDGSCSPDGKTGAGVVVKHALLHDREFDGLFFVSVPLNVESALQAELCACASAVLITQAMCHDIPLYSIINSLHQLCHKSIEDVYSTWLSIERSVRA